MTNNQKQWSEKYYTHMGEYYPDHFCNCPCHGQIVIQFHHKYNGIPKYLPGHYMRTQKAKEACRELQSGKTYEERFGKEKAAMHRAKQRMGHARLHNDPVRHAAWYAKRPKEIISKHISIATKKFHATKPDYYRWWQSNPIRIERFRRSRGLVTAGPEWYLNIHDFIIHACWMFDISYSRAEDQIFMFMSNLGYNKLDILIFTNLMIGHNQWELEDYFEVSSEYMYEIMKRIIKDFPGVLQPGITISSTTRMIDSEIVKSGYCPIIFQF